MRLKIVLLVLVTILVVSFTEIAAQQLPDPNPNQCGSRAKIVDALEKNWQEHQNFLGLINPAIALEIFINEEKHTWSALTSNTNGQTCVFASGKGIELFKKFDLEE